MRTLVISKELPKRRGREENRIAQQKKRMRRGPTGDIQLQELWGKKFWGTNRPIRNRIKEDFIEREA